MTDKTISGNCLCKRVTVTLRNPPDGLVLCREYCTDCRQFTGAMAAYLFEIREPDMVVDGPVKKFTLKADSGTDCHRFFCPECGSSVYDHPEGDEFAYVHAGLFKTHTIPPPVMEIFMCNAESWEKAHDCQTRER